MEDKLNVILDRETLEMIKIISCLTDGQKQFAKGCLVTLETMNKAEMSA